MKNVICRPFWPAKASFVIGALALIWSCSQVSAVFADESLQMTLRSRDASQENGDRVKLEKQRWNAGKTAVIVCDMWNAHHCYRAVQRETEMVPRMNQLISSLRDSGCVVIHAPSGCMDYYAQNPARSRVRTVPASKLPSQIGSWCYSIPAEERSKYPIDQTDGGEDDTPEEHASWIQELTDRGLNPRAPWTHQHLGIKIDETSDYITDQGDEVWNVLTSHSVENVMLVGVHTNMCVLGRPFGLRQLARHGKNVVLVRDMTDTMYNPKAWPYVSHFKGTELIIQHVESYVCPTVASDQILGGKPFKFAGQDTAP